MFFSPTLRSPNTMYELRSRDSGGPATTGLGAITLAISVASTRPHRLALACIARPYHAVGLRCQRENVAQRDWRTHRLAMLQHRNGTRTFGRSREAAGPPARLPSPRPMWDRSS